MQMSSFGPDEEVAATASGPGETDCRKLKQKHCIVLLHIFLPSITFNCLAFHSQMRMSVMVAQSEKTRKVKRTMTLRKTKGMRS